ncbi:MAG: hypothetical protein ACK5MT_13105 [Actinomycetales bacterium]
MGTAALLGIAIGAVIVLLVLVIKVKLPAFVALLLVSMGTALVTDAIPLEEVVPVMVAGMGKVLGSVAIIVGLGSMLGRLIEVSGGADHLARTFTERLGEKRVVAALTCAAFILGIPVFFDVGFIILAPIIFGFAHVTGINPLKIGLPVAITLLTVHVALPPHPGPVASAAQIGTDVGLLTLVGIALCIPVALAGYLLARVFRLDAITLLPSPATDASTDTLTDTSADTDPAAGSSTRTARLEHEPGTGGSAPVRTTGASGGGGTVTATERRTVPSTAMVIFLIVLPISMIMIGSTLQTVLGEDSALRPLAQFVGAPTTALLVGLLVAYVLIGNRAGWSAQRRSLVSDSALPTVAVIIFVTGAGGVFGNVLVESGIGDALSTSLTAVGLPLIVAAWVISLALRAAQGSATVAILTTGGLLSPGIQAGDYSTVQVVAITLAIGFGALGLSHINDSGFWIVTKYLGLSIADGLKTWTVLTTACAAVGFVLSWLVFTLA